MLSDFKFLRIGIIYQLTMLQKRSLLLDVIELSIPLLRIQPTLII